MGYCAFAAGVPNSKMPLIRVMRKIGKDREDRRNEFISGEYFGKIEE
jgi:hypothetical protein